MQFHLRIEIGRKYNTGEMKDENPIEHFCGRSHSCLHVRIHHGSCLFSEHDSENREKMPLRIYVGWQLLQAVSGRKRSDHQDWQKMPVRFHIGWRLLPENTRQARSGYSEDREKMPARLHFGRGLLQVDSLISGAPCSSSNALMIGLTYTSLRSNCLSALTAT